MQREREYNSTNTHSLSHLVGRSVCRFYYRGLYTYALQHRSIGCENDLVEMRSFLRFYALHASQSSHRRSRGQRRCTGGRDIQYMELSTSIEKIRSSVLSVDCIAVAFRPDGRPSLRPVRHVICQWHRIEMSHIDQHFIHTDCLPGRFRVYKWINLIVSISSGVSIGVTTNNGSIQRQQEEILMEASRLLNLFLFQKRIEQVAILLREQLKERVKKQG